MATPLPPAHRPLAGTAEAAQPVARPATSVKFSYDGPTRLQAEGPITRQRYRFEHTGAIVAVDARDAASLAAIPHLRRVRVAPG